MSIPMKIIDQQLENQKKCGDGNHPSDGENASIRVLIKQIALAQATDLASAGRYLEAENLLTEMMRGEEETPMVLDLFARIRAQQGRLIEAEAFWAQAARLDPFNEAYKSGLHRIARMQSRPIWMDSIIPLVVGLAVTLVVVMVGFVVLGYVNEQYTSLKSEVAKLAIGQEEITSQITLGKPPDLKIKVPGVFLKTETNEVIVTFKSGLFARGACLKPEAKTVLTTLGRQLEPYIGHISICVIGHTDDVPMPVGSVYRDNIALGINRAVAVTEHLRATTQIPFSIFSVHSLGESLAPYPNDTPDNRSMNRTVVIRISNIRKW
ncbi:MAG: OmpA family protein [Gammaproteobacteria bacterium]|nr:OmpA family protein [Gammaproteobacteria bacterium]